MTSSGMDYTEWSFALSGSPCKKCFIAPIGAVKWLCETLKVTSECAWSVGEATTSKELRSSLSFISFHFFHRRSEKNHRMWVVVCGWIIAEKHIEIRVSLSRSRESLTAGCQTTRTGWLWLWHEESNQTILKTLRATTSFSSVHCLFGF